TRGPSGAAGVQHSFVLSNTSDTVTYAYDTSFNPKGNLIFNTGDGFEIRKVIAALDQPGRGKGDLISGNFPKMLNMATKSVSWPHQAAEPCYSWNNVHTDGKHYGFSSPYPSIKAN